MKIVKIVVATVGDGEQVSGSILIQKKRSDTWIQVRTLTYISDGIGEEQVIPLHDDERLVLDGSVSMRRVLDKQQNALVPDPNFRPAPTTVADDDGTENSPSALKRAMDEEALARARTMARERIKAKPAPDPIPALQDGPAEPAKKWPPAGVGK